MPVTRSAMSLGGVFSWMGMCAATVASMGGGLARADVKAEKPDAVALGYEIFNREWLPNDPRSHGGDGLGPVYNDSSCVACHNSGGSGGAGPVSKNIDILNAGRNGGMVAEPVPPTNSKAAPQTVSTKPLTDLHAGFGTSRTVVLHKFGIDPNYETWRNQAFHANGANFAFTPPPVAMVGGAVDVTLSPFSAVEPLGQPSQGQTAKQPTRDRAMERLNQIRSAVFGRIAANRQAPVAAGSFVVSRSQRNPTPLFGLGLIDSITEEAILAVEKRQAQESPETRGRASRLKDGRIGRLGWKGQTANIEDFVLNACAVELGLEVPGHHQAMIPQAPRYKTDGLDLTSDECSALVAYVRSLPRPAERKPALSAEVTHLESGRASFAAVGCASCHTPSVGSVEGIYSDMLLHDMGQEMGDDGSYADNTSEDDEPLVPRIIPSLAANGTVSPAPGQAGLPRGATRQEWKTPPLWGFRDSGPYLHDGRAQTLDEAVALHGGQGAGAAHRYFKLSPREQLEVQAFLKSLVAPTAVRVASNAD